MTIVSCKWGQDAIPVLISTVIFPFSTGIKCLNGTDNSTDIRSVQKIVKTTGESKMAEECTSAVRAVVHDKIVLLRQILLVYTFVCWKSLVKT